jgi:hypothetical protein
MSDSYAKVFSSILDSTVWGEDLATRVVWITLLVKASRDGIVYASIPGLARSANVTREQVEAALEKLMAHDPDSSSSDHDGRRIEVVDGGWRILNYEKYRDRKTKDDVNAKSAERMARKRARDKQAAAEVEATGEQ